MKKLIIGTASALLIMGASASAHEYNNSAFMGRWTPKTNTESNYSELYVNYLDKENIQVNFKQVTDGKELFDFTEYAGTVTNQENHIEARVNFDYTDEYGTTKSGHMELAMFLDNIWLSVYADNGVTFFNNAVYSDSQPFNPYRSPYSSAFKLTLNGKTQDFGEIKPFIVNGTTYVPLRGLLDAMNLNVYWDDVVINGVHTQYITTTRNSKILQFTRSDNGKGYGPWTLARWDSSRADTLNNPNDSINISDRQPLIINDRSYVPLRILSEGYGAAIDWDDSTKTVTINDNIACDTKKSDAEITRIQKYTCDEADRIAKEYSDMVRYDVTPRYNYKAKYFIYYQDGKQYKLFDDGSVTEITHEPEPVYAEAEANNNTVTEASEPTPESDVAIDKPAPESDVAIDEK